MKKLPYIISIALSLAMCAATLCLPIKGEMLWQNPCVNVYSAFATVFLAMNSIGMYLVVGKKEAIWKKPYTEERPSIEEKKRCATGVVLTFFEVPLLLSIFYIDGDWKMAACSALFVGGSLIVGGLAGEMAAGKLRKEYAEIEQKELAEQLKKENG